MAAIMDNLLSDSHLKKLICLCIDVFCAIQENIYCNAVILSYANLENTETKSTLVRRVYYRRNIIL